ncbi:uncharacterized protein [Cherax quadricarinatus]|uniref:uncharacterized protein n=1 Tax=Cherax quadricarinatus TaxID=27406 RepID=UPI00387E5524
MVVGIARCILFGLCSVSRCLTSLYPLTLDGTPRASASSYPGCLCGSSASSSAPGTSPGSRVPSLPPIRGATASSTPDTQSHDMRHGLRNTNSIIARRGVSKGFGQDRQTSTDTLEYLTEPESPGLPKAVRRKSLPYPSDDSLSVSNLHLDSSPQGTRNPSKSLPRQTIRRKSQSQQRRRAGSISSSEGESPTRKTIKQHRKDIGAPVRRRANSLGRLRPNANPTGNGPSSTTNNKRRLSIPGRKGRAKSPDVFDQIGFALHY